MRAGTAPLLAAMACSPFGLTAPTSAGRADPATPDRQPTVVGVVPTSPRVSLAPRVIDLFQRASIAVTGVPAGPVEVGLIGATDATGLAYKWAPYRWQRLRLLRGAWRGVLPAPALRGIYQLQLRLRHRVLRSLPSLLEVFRPGTLTRRPFPAAAAVVRDYIAHLPGDQSVVALRSWRHAPFDHRDPRLHRIFAVAYAPRGDGRPDSRLGLFITVVRNGFGGRWRLLEAGVEPYG